MRMENEKQEFEKKKECCEKRIEKLNEAIDEYVDLCRKMEREKGYLHERVMKLEERIKWINDMQEKHGEVKK